MPNFLRMCDLAADLHFTKTLLVFIVIYFGIALKLQTKYKRTATTICSCNCHWFFFTKLLLFWQTADMAHTKCPPSFSNPLINGRVLDGIFKRSVFLAFAQRSNYHQKNWGVSTTGKSILAKRSNFKPVFYVINDIIHSQTPNFDPNPR